MRLISMTDFVLEQFEKMPLQPTQQECVLHNLKIVNYANFLKQPLKLGMFVPCDEESNVLEEPNHLDYKYEKYKGELHFKSDYDRNKYCEKYEEFYQAKEKVLFIHAKEICYSGLFFDTFKNIEDLLKINYSEFNLTKNAIKQIGL